jgi:DNA-directed RNA polymerase specialized sigma24 family protein
MTNPEGFEPQTTLHVRRAAAGDGESTAWLVERFAPLLLAQARLRLPPELRRHVEPEDLVQDAWAVALPRLRELPPRDGRLTPVVLRFLCTTILYRVNNLLQRRLDRSLRAADDEGDAGPPLSRLVASESLALERVLRGEACRYVLAAIDALDETDRRIVVLRGIDQKFEPSHQRCRGDPKGFAHLRFVFVEPAQRDEPFGAGVAEQPVDEPLDLVAVGLHDPFSGHPDCEVVHGSTDDLRRADFWRCHPRWDQPSRAVDLAAFAISKAPVSNAEFATYGQMPLENTALYCDRVGEKNRCGVLVYAWASVLKDVSTIHRTGKKNTMPTIQPTMPRVMLLPRFFLGATRRGAALAMPASAVLMSALVIMPPALFRRTR